MAKELSRGEPSEAMPSVRHSFPMGLLPYGASIVSGSLHIAGVEIQKVADEIGTPFFIYDEDHIRTTIRNAKEAFSGEIAFASKAFLCKEMARLADQEGILLDVASMGEMYVAHSAGFPGDRMIFHGNNKSDQELAFAIEIGVGRIVIDSFDEIDRLESLASAKEPVSAWLRVTPGVEAHTHEYVMTGQEDSKFGFSYRWGAAQEAIELLRSSSKIRLLGLHSHIGSQIFRLDSFKAQFDVMAELISRYGFTELNLGGGLGVAYVDGEEAPEIASWVAMAQRYSKEAGLPDSLRLVLEPGRAIVARSAITVYRVGTIKRLKEIRTYVSVDGGMSDNPRPVLYESGYEAILPSRMEDVSDTIYTISGKHCESGDILVSSALLPSDLAVGELLATPVTGAYGYSMASNYNKVGRPPVVFAKDGHYRVVVRRETLDDLLHLEE